MADVEHNTLHDGANMHAIHRWSPADQTARFALTVTSSDIGKVAYQEDNKTFWALRDDTAVGNANGWRELSDVAALAAAAAAQTTADTHASRHKGDGADTLNSTTITESGTSRTIALADMSDYIRFTSGSASTCTFPKNATTAIPVDSIVFIRQGGAGAVTLTPEDGTVTLNAPAGGSLVTNGTGATVAVKKVATNVWDVIGNTVPA